MKIYIYLIHKLYYFINAILIFFKLNHRHIEYHEPSVKFLSELITNPNPIIFEIGAHDGSTTLEFLKYFSNSKIVAFEPGKTAAELFQGKQFPPQVHFENIAISDQNFKNANFYESYGSAPDGLFKNNDYNLSSSLLEPYLHKFFVPWVKFSQTYQVKTCSLDSWILNKNIKTIDLLWIDTQGSEYNIFKGATKTLKLCQYIFFEYSFFPLYKRQGTLLDILDVLNDFSILKIYRNDILLKKKQISMD